MPALVLIFMHQPRYFTAPLFVAGVALATAAAVVVAVASWIVGSAGSRDP
jgi:hypothetical protein